jgi:hypothetical protein
MYVREVGGIVSDSGEDEYIAVPGSPAGWSPTPRSGPQALLVSLIFIR